jgi:hypothetical protein
VGGRRGEGAGGGIKGCGGWSGEGYGLIRVQEPNPEQIHIPHSHVVASISISDGPIGQKGM